ncbi:hypothetical protein GF324_01545, partial [bacterium]|nr:hypothetical protein [bacterium]
MQETRWMQRRRKPAQPLKPGRAAIAVLVLAMLGGATAVRLVEVQILRHEEFATRAERQYKDRREIEARRGMIYDRRGMPLVNNLPSTYSIGIRPYKVENKTAAARMLAGLLEMDFAEVFEAVHDDAPFVWLRRKVDRRLAEQVKQWGGDRIGLKRETRRAYPFRSVGGQV